MTVNGVNDDPVAGNDKASTSENNSFSGSVLGNDRDIDRLDTLSVVAIAQTAITNGVGATLALDSSGNYILDATNADALSQGEAITQDFTYTLLDNHGASTTATLSVTVNGVNDDPVALDDDAGSITEDQTASGNVIGNDDDIDRRDSIRVTAVNSVTDNAADDLDTDVGSIRVALASGAFVTMKSDGSFTYDTNGASEALNDGDEESVSFKYTLADNHDATDDATATLRIIGVTDGDSGGGGGNDFPTWAQNISHVTLVFDFDQDGNGIRQVPGIGDKSPHGLDGYYTVKIDNWPDSANDDLDHSIDSILAYLIAGDPHIEANTNLLGAVIKGGQQITTYYAYGNNNTNGDTADILPADVGFDLLGTKANESPSNAIDKSYDYDSIFS